MGAKPTAQTEKLARELATQAGTIDELNGLMKSALGRMPGAEMGDHLASKGTPLPFEPPAPNNRRYGHPRKAAQGEPGEVRIDAPRDRDGASEPRLIGRYQRRLAGFDEKALAPHAKGLTTSDVQDVVQEL